MLFAFSLAWDCQHKLICILYTRWHRRCLVSAYWDTILVLAGKGWIWSSRAEMHSVKWFGFGQPKLIHFVHVLVTLVNSDLDVSFDLAGMGGFWSTHVEMLERVGFDQHKLICIFCAPWHGRGFFYTCWDTSRILAGKGWTWSTYVEIYFVCSLIFHLFGQQMYVCEFMWLCACPCFNACLYVCMYFCVCMCLFVNSCVYLVWMCECFTTIK